MMSFYGIRRILAIRELFSQRTSHFFFVVRHVASTRQPQQRRTAEQRCSAFDSFYHGP